MPIVVALDGFTLNPGDLDWKPLRQLSELTVYDRSQPEEVVERSASADILLVNKQKLSAETIQQLPNLKCICVTATGYNNVNLEAASQRNIPVCNAVGYGSDSVAQHVFALILALINRVELHNTSVQQGHWASCPDFSYTLSPITELAGKTLGIYGFGKIGQQVATIAQAFGMNILSTHKHPERDARPGVDFVPLDELFSRSDIVTLHAPLSSENEAIVNQKLLSKMKPTAYLINTGRGGLIQEQDLAHALKNKQLAGAGLDVLSVEPPTVENPLFGIPNCLITPHLAWASKEARQRLLDITVENVRAFLNGRPQNVVNEIRE